jgi:hypothetical protein
VSETALSSAGGKLVLAFGRGLGAPSRAIASRFRE